MKQDLFGDRKHRFSIRTYSVGVASVMIGALVMGATQVQAEEVTAGEAATTASSEASVAGASETAASSAVTYGATAVSASDGATSTAASSSEGTATSANAGEMTGTEKSVAGLSVKDGAVELTDDQKATSEAKKVADTADAGQAKSSVDNRSEATAAKVEEAKAASQGTEVVVEKSASVAGQDAVALPGVVAVAPTADVPVEKVEAVAAVVRQGSLAQAARESYAGELSRRRSAAMSRDVRDGQVLPASTGFRADTNLDKASVQVEISNGDGSSLTSQRQGKITITGGGTKTEDKGYIDITLPHAAYITSFELNGGTFASEYEQIDHADGSATFRVKTGEITPTTSATIYFGVNYNFKMMPTKVKNEAGQLVTYTERPQVTLYGEDKTIALAPTTGTITFEFPSDPHKLVKEVVKNNEELKDDNQVLNGGIDANADGYIDAATAEGVEFRFWYETSVRNQRETDGVLSLVDELPTYVNKAGESVRAQFKQEENPYWKLSADGTKVELDVEAYKKAVAEHQEKLRTEGYSTENISRSRALYFFSLKLHFPEAKDRVYLDNHATMTLKPKDQRVDLGEPTIVISDGIKFYLTTETLPSGFFSKNSPNKNNHSVKLFEGSAHLSYGTYTITLRNPGDKPIKEFTITDDTFDSRLYLMGLQDSFFGRGDTELYAIKNDGTEEKIDYLGFTERFDGTNYDVSKIIDKEAYLHNKENAEKIEAGTLKVADARPATASYKGFKIRLKDGKVINQTQELTYTVHFGFLDPLNMDRLTNTPVFDNTARLDINFEKNGKEFKVTNLESQNFFTVETKKESFSINKSVSRFGYTGNVGNEITYDISLNFNGMGKMRSFKNPRVIEVLPKGFEFTSAISGANSKELDYEIVNNYKNSGHQAVIIKLSGERAGDMNASLKDPTPDPNTTRSPNSGMVSISIKGKITDEMIPEKFVTETNNNMNRVYFLADGLNTDQIAAADDRMLLPDIYDIDGDGDTTEKVFGAEANIKVNIPTEMKSIKYIGKEDSETKIIGWTKQMIETDYNEDFFYRLTTQNFSTYSIKSFVLYDRLPLAGDSRDSKFVNTLRGEVKADERFTVYYHTAADMSEKPEESIKRDGWVTADNITDFSKVTAIKIELNEGQEIEVAQTVGFDVPMRAPEGDIKTGTYNGQSATNNYYTDRTVERNNFGVTNSVSNKMVSSGDVKVMYVKKGTNISLKDTEVVKSQAPIDEAYTTEAPKIIQRSEWVQIGNDPLNRVYQSRVYRLVGLRGDSAPATGKVTQKEQVVVYEYELASNIRVNYFATEMDIYNTSFGMTTIKDMQLVFPDYAAPGISYDATTETFRPMVIEKDGKKYKLATDLTEYRSDIVDETFTLENGVITGYKDSSTAIYHTTKGELPETVESIYYVYELVGDVDVTYKDDEGNILEATSLVKDGAAIGERYTTLQKEFKDYDFVGLEEGSAPAQGTVAKKAQHVVYIYKKQVGDVLVHYVDEAGNKLQEDVLDAKDQKVGTNYDTTDHKASELTVDGKLYRLVPAKTVGKETGVIVKGTTEVTYVYAQVHYGDVIVHYVDENGQVLRDDYTDTKQAEVGTAYNTAENASEKPLTLTVDGKNYELIRVDGAETGRVVEGVTEVTYVYKLKEEPKVPEVPTTPEKPKTPERPQTPDKPVTPQPKPQAPVTPHEAPHKAQLPQTGEESSIGLLGMAVAAALGAFGLAAGKRKKED